MRPSRFQQTFLVVSVSLMFVALVSEKRPGAVELLAAQHEEGPVTTPRTTIGISRSDKKYATEIDDVEVRELVAQSVRMAGGLSGVVGDGDVVAIKPNLVTPYDDSAAQQLLPIEVNGITTDWRVTRALVGLVREVNPNGRIVIMEGSAGVGTQWNMNRLRYTRESMPEVDEFICLEDSGAWHQWDSPLLSIVTLPQGMGLYPDYLKPNRSEAIFLNKKYYEADVLISVPVLKNHYCTGITGAIKNIGIGATPANIYGSSPSEIWRGTGIDHTGNMEYLHKWIHDFYLAKPIDFVVMDGLQSVSHGPTCYNTASYEANKQNMRVILAGKDAIATDAIASLIVGIDPYAVDHLVQLGADGMGIINPALIRVEGHLVHGIKKSFDLNAPGSYAKYTDFTPPEITIQSIRVDGDQLKVALLASPDTALVEIAVEGRRLDPAVIDGFDDITLDIRHIRGDVREITVYGYDRFLNGTVVRFPADGS